MLEIKIIADCDWCAESQTFDLKMKMKEAERILMSWGWIKHRGKIFCNMECKGAYMKEEVKQLNKPQ